MNSCQFPGSRVSSSLGNRTVPNRLGDKKWLKAQDVTAKLVRVDILLQNPLENEAATPSPGCFSPNPVILCLVIMFFTIATGRIVQLRPPGQKMKAIPSATPTTNIVDFPLSTPSHCAFPRPSEPTPQRTLIDRHVFEASNRMEQSNSSTQSQFSDALNPPAGLNSEKMHAAKRNRFSVPWAIQPPPSLTPVDCGVIMTYERAEPLKWTARSPIGHAFHPP
jgi:hypothetical protein